MYVRNPIWVSCSFGFTIWLHLQVVKCDAGDMFDEAGNVPTPAPDSELQPAPAPEPPDSALAPEPAPVPAPDLVSQLEMVGKAEPEPEPEPLAQLVKMDTPNTTIAPTPEFDSQLQLEPEDGSENEAGTERNGSNPEHNREPGHESELAGRKPEPSVGEHHEAEPKRKSEAEVEPEPELEPVYRPKAEPESKSDPELVAVVQCKEPRAGVEPENKRKMTIYLSCSNMQSFNTFCEIMIQVV